ncbi:MAG: hypothetical protein NC388_10725 [Clostridium sp.]|nr:hypothetical protein [Clostridium sp.]
MKKQTIFFMTVAALAMAGCGNRNSAEQEEMLKLIEMDKMEMENEYEEFAKQYSELKMQINNDSLIAQLDQEQRRTQELLEELKKVKTTDAAEITRLKKELATVRAVMRSYILEIDSLNRLNQALTDENERIKSQYNQAQSHISSLTSEKENLSEKVAIASQLDASSITVSGQNKRGREAKKIKDVKKFLIGFTITKNITAETGNRSLYVRITKPTNEVLTNGGTFSFEDRQLEYSIKKDIEYTGEEQRVTVYWDVNEFLSTGTYRVDIFAGGYNIGSSTFSYSK